MLLLFLSGVACSLLVLCGKSLAENETAKAIKTNNTLKLPEDEKLSLVLHSEMDKSVMQGFFQVHSYMDSLSTNQFGRLLVWSPDLTSTHDVVSQYVLHFCLLYALCFINFIVLNIAFLCSNFCELPIGTVCIADVQTKGRGLI